MTSFEERVQRLKGMLTKVAGTDGLESVSPPRQRERGFESVDFSTEESHANAAQALEKLKRNEPITPQEAFGLEAIILPDKRPVVFIRNNIFDPLEMDEWLYLNDATFHTRLEALFPSIGRIELPNGSFMRYYGTGFVVGEGLLMTNRHVARIFADGVGTHIRYHSGEAGIDFKREYGGNPNDASARLEVEDVLMVHPYWDMALLKVSGLPASAGPLPLSVGRPEEFIGQDIAVVGYPAQDLRNALDVQERVFGGQYGVKRMQPGKAQPRRKYKTFENLVDAMTHDSSTLGGNSGSVLIHIDSGKVIGLHFAGEYLDANFAVPMYELARDKRVLKAGVLFDGSVAATTDWDGAWQSVGDFGESKPSRRKRAKLIAPGSAPTLTVSSASNRACPSANFTIPLNVTVSLGSPYGASSAASAIMADATMPAADEFVEKVPTIYPDIDEREGYAEGFLEFEDGTTVPLPELTAAGKKLAAKLEDGSPVLHYHKFSVVVHKKRRLALFTAANVDWRPEKRQIRGKKPTRKKLDGFIGNEREDWIIDSRIPLDFQLPDYFYTKDGGTFDKGHLVRRDDVAWGDSFEDMQMGNGDTFHTTNCSPQTAGFNRAKEFNWGALENMVEKETKAEKVCIFSGPVLDDDDEYFHGLIKSKVEVSIQIPQQFWKIIVANNDGKPAAFGFVLDHDLEDVDLYTELAVPDAWKDYMRPISEIEGYLKGLAKLTVIKEWDQFEGE